MRLEEVSRVRTKEWGKEIDNNNCCVWEHIFLEQRQVSRKSCLSKNWKKRKKELPKGDHFDEIPILFYMQRKERIRGNLIYMCYKRVKRNINGHSCFVVRLVCVNLNLCLNAVLMRFAVVKGGMKLHSDY